MMTVSMVGAVVACAAVGIVYRLPWFYILVLAIAAGSLVAYLYLRYFMLYFNFAMFVNIALLLIMGNNLGFLQYGAPVQTPGHYTNANRGVAQLVVAPCRWQVPLRSVRLDIWHLHNPAPSVVHPGAVGAGLPVRERPRPPPFGGVCHDQRPSAGLRHVGRDTRAPAIQPA